MVHQWSQGGDTGAYDAWHGGRGDAGDRRGHGQCAYPGTAIEVHEGQKRGAI